MSEPGFRSLEPIRGTQAWLDIHSEIAHNAIEAVISELSCPIHSERAQALLVSISAQVGSALADAGCAYNQN